MCVYVTYNIELHYINGPVRELQTPCLLPRNQPTGMVLMPQHDLYFYICFTYDYVITYFQFAITIRLHYRVRCNPKVIQIQLTANDIHEVLRAPALCQ